MCSEGDKMPSLCPICQNTFDNWSEYHEHVALAHAVQPTAQQIVANAPSRPVEAKRREYKVMDRQTKKKAVERGEKRLGVEHFIGGK